MKSQRAPEKVGELESKRRMAVTAGYSVDVSGFNSGVNCATGYTYVWLEAEGAEERAGFFSDGCMRGFKTVDAYATKFSGSSRGEGAPLANGQSKRYPEALCGSGSTEKLRLQTAW